MKRFRATLFPALAAACCLFAVAGFTPAARAADAQETVKARMAGRLLALDALKARGVLGEKNRGLLTVLGAATADEQALAAAENADRTAVYAAIAAKTGAIPAAVGARRAARIAESAPAGVKIQAADGTWTAKK